MSRSLMLLFTLLATGCITQSSLDGRPLPPEAQGSDKRFFVEHQPKDARHFDRSIAEALRRRGLDASFGEARPADYIVTYIDRWYWDMRNYLIDLRIDVRDAENGILVATARSYQTSLSAMGQTQEDIIEKVVDVLVEGMNARLNSRKVKPEKRRMSRY